MIYAGFLVRPHYFLLLFHYLLRLFHKKNTKVHLDVLFRTVSRGSRVPQGPFSEGSEGWRGLKKVEEGWRRPEKVGESWRESEKCEKEGQRKVEKVGGS